MEISIQLLPLLLPWQLLLQHDNMIICRMGRLTVRMRKDSFDWTSLEGQKNRFWKLRQMLCADTDDDTDNDENDEKVVVKRRQHPKRSTIPTGNLQQATSQPNNNNDNNNIKSEHNHTNREIMYAETPCSLSDVIKCHPDRHTMLHTVKKSHNLTFCKLNNA